MIILFMLFKVVSTCDLRLNETLISVRDFYLQRLSFPKVLSIAHCLSCFGDLESDYSNENF